MVNRDDIAELERDGVVRHGAGVAFLAGIAIVHLSFAVGVLIDTPRRRVLLPTPLRGLATLLGGVLVAGIYYALHYATCFEDRTPAQRPPAPTE